MKIIKIEKNCKEIYQKIMKREFTSIFISILFLFIIIKRVESQSSCMINGIDLSP